MSQGHENDRSRRAAPVTEPLEARRLLSGQLFSGQGPLAGKSTVVVAADFDNDGRVDLLTPGSGSSFPAGLGVRLGDGAGGFVYPPSAQPSVNAVRAAAAGD